MENINDFFLEQAKLLDPSWIDWLTKIVKFIQNNGKYNLFLLQVISNNINDSLKNTIKENEYESNIMISRLMQSLQSKKDIKTLIDVLPKDKYPLLKDSLEKSFTKEFAEKMMKKLEDNK